VSSRCGSTAGSGAGVRTETRARGSPGCDRVEWGSPKELTLFSAFFLACMEDMQQRQVDVGFSCMAWHLRDCSLSGGMLHCTYSSPHYNYVECIFICIAVVLH